MYQQIFYFFLVQIFTEMRKYIYIEKEIFYHNIDGLHLIYFFPDDIC